MNVDIRGETVEVGDVVAVARTNYRVAQLLVGLVTEITDTRIYYDCCDEHCDMKHWVIHYDNLYKSHKEPQLLVLASGATQYEFMDKFAPLRR